jgi:hypothetical protein
VQRETEGNHCEPSPLIPARVDTMTSYDFRHLTFLAVGGEIRGRTKQLSESAKELGWDATAEDIKESISFLEKLELVKREAKPKRTPGEVRDRQSG